MVDSRIRAPSEQHNHGSGTFIGRDNYGDVRYELVDPKTKLVLDRLSKDTPALAGLMTTALRDGVISPDAVAALQSAVRNINEDVAHALWVAGQNINEDVAHSLWQASRGINADVADKLIRAAEILREASPSLDQAVGQINRLDRLASMVGTISDAADRIEFADAPPSVSTTSTWTVRVKTFLWGLIIGAIATAILFGYFLSHSHK